MTNAQPNSAENPFPVRAVAIRVAGWIDKLGTVWVEGQLTQINLRKTPRPCSWCCATRPRTCR